MGDIDMRKTIVAALVLVALGSAQRAHAQEHATIEELLDKGFELKAVISVTAPPLGLEAMLYFQNRKSLYVCFQSRGLCEAVPSLPQRVGRPKK